MKKLIFIGLSIGQICALHNSFGQNALASINIKSTNAKHFNVVNDKADKNFRREFGNTYNPKWIEKEDGYRAKFAVDNIKYMVDYDKRGNWVSTILNYAEEHLEPGVADAVRAAFPRYSIVHVTEVRKGETTVFLVKIDNQKLLKTIRVVNGEMDVYESYIKS